MMLGLVLVLALSGPESNRRQHPTLSLAESTSCRLLAAGSGGPSGPAGYVKDRAPVPSEPAIGPLG